MSFTPRPTAVHREAARYQEASRRAVRSAPTTRRRGRTPEGDAHADTARRPIARRPKPRKDACTGPAGKRGRAVSGRIGARRNPPGREADDAANATITAPA
ncbi:hypothetical protein GCM10023224_19480 [Streptomonospora halophila]|uniref:Uncharacterized protein n=1 Tax=Streptomonospora halophila TaxID=427369 RepID=A0ABP9GEL8_9ACTN